MLPVSGRRSLLLKLRRQLKVRSRFSVEYLEGDRCRYTCRTCGASFEQRMGNAKVSLSVVLVKRLARYQNNGSGVQGVCEKCTQKARDERYPLPPR